ncbi:MAG: diguanylate cyclase [Lachnospiraceae bacterium]|nr:diguanylate cyclase [Lachnospiraceae bacterium]
MSIRKSLQTSMIIVAGLPIILFAILALILTYNNYLKITQEAIKATARNYQEGFEAQLNTQVVESEAIALDNDIISFLLKSYNDPDYDLLNDVDSRAKIEEKLIQSAETFDNDVIYSVYSLDGVVVCSSDSSLVGTFNYYVDDISDTLEYTQIDASATLNNHENALNILSPVSVKNKYIVGCIVTSIDAKYFENFVSQAANGYIIDASDHDLLGVQFDDATIRQDALSVLNGFTGDSDELHGFLSKGSLFSTELYGYSILPTYQWIYLIKQDTSIYQSILQTIPIVLVIVIVVFLVITIFSSSALAKQYTSPILDLRDQMRQASDGDLTVHSDIDRKDEFGELADHFNEMMSIISGNYNELNEMKQELELKQEELEANYVKIEKLAFTDALTGLNNRLAFMHHVKEVFDDKNPEHQRAILFIDLDNFKTVNDTLGHDYGDLLLQQVSDQLTAFMTEDDFLARTGGDEFLVLRDHVTSRMDLESFARKLITIVETPFDLNGEIAHVSMSLGIAIFPEHGLTSDEIIKNADNAMYSAKTSGKNAYRFYDSSMNGTTQK